VRYIKDFLRVGHLRIKNVIESYNNRIQLNHERGRPVKNTQEINHQIEIETLKNSCISALSLCKLISQKLGIMFSETSVNRIRKELKFNWRPPRIRQSLTRPQISMRYQFCHEALKSNLVTMPIYFSDDSTVFRFFLGMDKVWRVQ